MIHRKGEGKKWFLEKEKKKSIHISDISDLISAYKALIVPQRNIYVIAFTQDSFITCLSYICRA